MATAGGPDIERDGLVFGYDTGYGVADNNTATRFYPGEPTTNNTIQTGYGWNGDGTNQSFANKGATTITNNSLKYNGYDTVLWTPGSSLNCYLNGSSDLNLNDNSTIWTFSCYVKREDGAVISSLNVYLYYPNSDGSASGTIVDCGNGWYRVSRTRTGTSDNIGLAGFTGFSSGHKYYLSGVMLTKNNHTVPYVNVQSLRSSTQSLIDLTRTTTIDVSNVSFDSTGQPTFDGTDDYISLNTPPSLTGAFTVTCWFKKETNSERSFLGKTAGSSGTKLIFLTNNNIFFRMVDGGSSSNFSIGYTTSLNNEWNFLTATRSSSGVVSASINGNSLTTGGTLTGTFSPTAIGRNGDGQYWDGALQNIKIYNRALSADEIQQNYNAYKNRFNL
jgi:hypothetical protein